ncbi:unnamed protein product, partial [Prunus brigantina]
LEAISFCGSQGGERSKRRSTKGNHQEKTKTQLGSYYSIKEFSNGR